MAEIERQLDVHGSDCWLKRLDVDSLGVD